MQRIIQINLAGRVLPIEEDAYYLLGDYITALKRQFNGDDGKEIIDDIENRIAELFTIRLQNGVPAINVADVRKVMDTLGAPADINDTAAGGRHGYRSNYQHFTGNTYGQQRDRIKRDPFNKVIGGVCSGLAHYLDVDTVIVRLIVAMLSFYFGLGIVVYIIAWAIMPAAKTKSELNNNVPLTFHDVTRNVALELEDLKARAEQMSRELRDFFGKSR